MEPSTESGDAATKGGARASMAVIVPPSPAHQQDEWGVAYALARRSKYGIRHGRRGGVVAR